MTGGSPYAILLLPYKGGELHCVHLDGYLEDRGAFDARLSEITAYFHKKPENARFRIWLNLYGSVLSESAADAVIASLLMYREKIVRISLIGLGRRKRDFEKKLQSALGGMSLSRSYFEDAEKAKDFLL